MKSKYDVVILGGGTSGVAAAYALKNNGFDVLLIEKQESLGGTAVQGLVLDWIEGCHPNYLDNIFNELKSKELLTGNILDSWLPAKFSTKGYSNSLKVCPLAISKVYARDLSPYIDIGINYELIGIDNVEVKESVNSKYKVNSIKLKHKITNIENTVEANFFIDCTSSGQLCRFAGSNFYYGRDGKDFRNESIVLNKNPMIMNEPSLMFQVEKGKDDNKVLEEINTVYIDEKGTIVKPDYLVIDGYFQKYNWSNSDSIVFTCNPMTSLGITGFEILNSNEEKMNAEARKRVLEYWKYLKLLSKYKKFEAISGIEGKIEDYGILNFAPMIGTRESYRIECESMLDQYDLGKKIDFNSLGKTIAIGTHPIDMHIKTDLNITELNEFNSNRLQPYGVGFTCLIPKSLNNVLVAGKSFGATQIASSSARTNMFMAQIGWAAGNGVKLCLNNNINICDIDIEELRNEQYIDFEFYIKNIKGILK